MVASVKRRRKATRDTSQAATPLDSSNATPMGKKAMNKKVAKNRSPTPLDEESDAEVKPQTETLSEDRDEDADAVDAEPVQQNGTETAEQPLDFSTLVGIGEQSDSSDEDAPLEAVAVSRLPSKFFSNHRNDESALKKKLNDIAIFADGNGHQHLSFWESLSVTMPLEKKLPNSLAMDDLKREQRFAELATAAAHLGLDELRKNKKKFRRPGDYFAEMVKTDGHMGKIKAKILAQKEKIEAAEKRRNNRDIAKNRKKVRSTQLQKEQQKKQKANEEIEAVSRLRKQRLKERAEGSGDGVEDDGDEFPIELLDVEQLDEENRFRPQAEIASGKRKAWKEKKEGGGKADIRANDKQMNGGKGSKGRGRTVGKQGGGEKGRKKKEFGVSGGVKKPKGSKKRLGRSRRKAVAAKKS